MIAIAPLAVTLINLVLTPLIFTVPLGLRPLPVMANDPPLYELTTAEDAGAVVVTEMVDAQLLHPYEL